MKIQKLFTAFKLIVTFTCISLTLYQGSKCMARNSEGNIHDAVVMLPLSNPVTTFPAITICPTYNAAYNSSKLKAMNTTQNGYRRSGNFYGNSSDSSPENGLRLYEKVSFNIEEVIKGVTIDTWEKSEVKVPLNGEELLQRNLGKWNTVHYDYFGRCYSLTLNEKVQKWTITYVEVETLIHTYIYVHYPGHFHMPTELSPRDRGFTYPGVKQSVKVDHIELIDALGEQSKFPCNKSMNGVFDECAYRKMRENQLSKYGCTVPWMPQPLICHPERTKSIVKDVISYHNNIIKEPEMLSYCDAPCTNMRFTFGWPAKDENEDKDVGVLRMYFDMRAVILRATEDYSWQSMIGEIGGYAALLLGTAVIDLALKMDSIVSMMQGAFNTLKGRIC